MATIVKFYKDGKNVKDITSIGYLPVDEDAVKDSRHLASSGSVHEVASRINTYIFDITLGVTNTTYPDALSVVSKVREKNIVFLRQTSYSGQITIYQFSTGNVNGLTYDFKGIGESKLVRLKYQNGQWEWSKVNV